VSGSFNLKGYQDGVHRIQHKSQAICRKAGDQGLVIGDAGIDEKI